jgi:glutathione S-transferase
MVNLYAIDGCPYAQRTRALLLRLEEPYELRVVDPRNKPPDFIAASPNGKTPLLLDGPLKLYESFIINEYLVECRGWTGAHSTDVGQRARERLAMVRFDEVLVPEIFASAQSGKLPEGERLESLRRELAELAQTVEATSSGSLPGIHCGAFWARFLWVAEMREVPVLGIVAEYPHLLRWLNGVAELSVIRATLPEKAKILARF